MSAACLSWATICIAPCDCCFGWIRYGFGPEEEGSDDCNVLNHVQSFAGFSKPVYALRSASLFDEKLYRLCFVIAVTVAVRL